jgi:hypothetical protein
MSARNRRQEKKIRALDRAIRKGRLPRYIDLVKWLRDRRYANTAGGAEAIILAGRVKSESHTVGIAQMPLSNGKSSPVVAPAVPASLRPTLRVDPQGA